MTNDIHIYTDGACSGNPGPGGWGAVILRDEALDVTKAEEHFGGVDDTTNNRMELYATIHALQVLKDETGAIHIHTDSTYVKDGITSWVKNWQKNGWKTASKKDVKNKDLWQDLLAATAPLNVEWHWVKGHSGHPLNERADTLARNGVMKIMMKEAMHNI